LSERTAFYEARNSRSIKYPSGRVLDPKRRIAITAEPSYLECAEGQVAALVTANLLARMTPQITLAFKDVEIQKSIAVGSGKSLHEFALAEMSGADPYGFFDVGPCRADNYRLHLGSVGAEWIAHGSDWNAYVGPSPSPLPLRKTSNAFGAIFAAILAIAKIAAGPFPDRVDPTIADLLRWTPKVGEPTSYPAPETWLGNIWFIGAGSVGSAVAYFLTLAGLKFECTIFDHDVVKVENLDRSPIFTYVAAKSGQRKVDAIAQYLERLGIRATPEPYWLDNSPIWKARQQGVPDIMISAANERNVRYGIESLYPPIQIYGTTGQNWQASVLRHIPTQDACTCCIFPPLPAATTDCATGSVNRLDPATGEVTQVDAALPFLSFGAGLMAAAEACKLLLFKYPFSVNRACFTPCADEVVFARSVQIRDGCLCRGRSPTVHAKMIAGSKFANLSQF
jgi:hypothetical protein